MNKERRRHRRQKARLVVGIDSDERSDRAGLTLDVSPAGALFRSSSHFEIGEVLKLRFRDPRERNRNLEVFGTVVHARIEPARSLFPNIAAVSFRQDITALAGVPRQAP